MNDRFIKIFTDLAAFEDFNKRTFPAKAYRNAIKIFKELDFEVNDADQIKDIAGIGSGIYNKVKDYLETGTFKRYQEYLASPAAKIKEIAEIKGFGMNKAKTLYEAGIQSLDQLKEVCKDLKVGAKIKDCFNFTKAMKIGLDFEAHTDKNRMTVAEHDAVAEPILASIRQSDFVNDASAVGSRRRYDGSEGYTIGDIDIIVSMWKENNTEEIRKSFERLLDEVTMSGETKISGIKNHRQVDIRIITPDKWGSTLLHCTGPMDFNIKCRRIAIKHNWILNEYGLFNKDTKECLASDTEENILKMLGIPFVEPKNRKNFTI